MELLNKRYKFQTNKNFIYMSKESIDKRNAFIDKYPDSSSLKNQNCYICNNKSFNIISKIDRYGFFYPTGLCKSCGNVQQKKYYDEEVLNDFYSNYYRKIYGNRSSIDTFKIQRKNGLNIYSFLKSLGTYKNVLEVGCGAGGILSVFKDHGCNVLGLDFDNEFLNEAIRNNVNVKKGSFNKLNKNKKFDLIIINHVLEHIVKPVDFLNELKAYLDIDGKIYIEVPSLEDVHDGAYLYDLLKYFQNAHSIHFNIKTLGLVCKKAGLKCLKMNKTIQSCWSVSNENKLITQNEKNDCLDYSISLVNQIEKNRKNSFVGSEVKIKYYLRRIIPVILDLIGIKENVKLIYKKLLKVK